MIDITLIKKCEEELKEQFCIVENIALFNQEKVLNAFQKNKVALRHFVGSTGYGYGDEGRDVLNQVVADVFKAEAGVCSPLVTSGTHALSTCLYAVLRPNDYMLSVTGEPYDTLRDVICGENNGSLKDFNIGFKAINLVDGKIDYESVKKALQVEKMPKMVYLQRSRGYEWRNALSIAEIRECVQFVRNLGFDGCIMLDNCYGEFIEEQEPIEAGVNLLAGSMIKNLGGGIAPTGGYIVGDKKYVKLVQNRITAPSIGGEVGSFLSGYQYFYEGIFLAPHVVLQAVKGALLFSKAFSKFGYETFPQPNQLPRDIITSIKFNDKQKLINFIQCIQSNSPIDSNVSVEPWEMPGYEDQVIMAAGCFVQGSSIELSADAPIRAPYIAYLQGGLTYEHCVIALKNFNL